MRDKVECRCSGGGSDAIWWGLLIWFWWYGGCDMVKDYIKENRAAKQSVPVVAEKQ